MQRLIQPLLPLYDRDEARALLRMLVEDLCHESWTRFIACGCQPDDTLLAAIDRLATGEPVQHILGFACFCEHQFRVTPDTLIPRPETEELVQWIESHADSSKQHDARILDIGTGTGCIAISLALALPQARVTALDISFPALTVASRNWHDLADSAGHRTGGDDTGRWRIMQHDILSPTPPPMPQQDIIVSNPPYVCRSEAAGMHTNVLDHDPHLALFVPDDDPLLFYRAIARHALTLLRPGGTLFFELNTAYAYATCELLSRLGFTSIQLRRDRYDRPRMLQATLRQL